jgi:hypothetical protein
MRTDSKLTGTSIHRRGLNQRPEVSGRERVEPDAPRREPSVFQFFNRTPPLNVLSIQTHLGGTLTLANHCPLDVVEPKLAVYQPDWMVEETE